MNILNLCAAALLFAQGPMPPAENAGPNASIVRRAGGSYAYTTISDGRHRGEGISSWWYTPTARAR